MSKEIIISFLLLGKSELERAIKATDEEKLNWRPLDNGRPALDLMGDAAQAPALCVGLMKGELQYSPETFQMFREQRAPWTRDEVLAKLEANTQELIELIQTFGDEKLNESLTMPIGGGLTMPVGSWILMAYRSFMSRTAQINYIQTLYGDFERH